MNNQYTPSEENDRKAEDYKKLPLIDLIIIISLKNRSKKTTNLAMSELVARAEEYLRYKTHHYCLSNKISDTEFEFEVVSYTICKLFDNIEKLLAIQKYEDESHQELALKAWLGTTIVNRVKEHIRNLKEEYVDLIFEDMEIYSNIEVNDGIPQKTARLSKHEKRKAKLADALATLNEKQRGIVLTYYKYQDKNKKLPKNVMDEMCSYFNITPDYARKLKQRALDKIKLVCKTPIEEI